MQPPVVASQLVELGPLGRNQPAIDAGAGVTFGLLDALPHRGLGQIEVPRNLTDRAITALALLDDLSFEVNGGLIVASRGP